MAIITSAPVILLSCSGCGAEKVFPQDPMHRGENVRNEEWSKWYEQHLKCPDRELVKVSR